MPTAALARGDVQVTVNLPLALQVISGAKYLFMIKHTGIFLRDQRLRQAGKSQLHCSTYVQATGVVNREETKCRGHHCDKACLQLYFVLVTFPSTHPLCTILLNKSLFKRYKALSVVPITNYSVAPAESCRFPFRRGAGTWTVEPEPAHHNHRSEVQTCNPVPHIAQLRQTLIKLLPYFVIKEVSLSACKALRHPPEPCTT